MMGHGRKCDCDDCFEADALQKIDKMPCYSSDCGEVDTKAGHTCSMQDYCPREIRRKQLRQLIEG